MISAAHKALISSKSETTPKSFKMTVTTTVIDTAFTIVAGNTGAYDATVIWGDGNPDSTITTYNDADLTNTYSAIGSYTVEITGDFPNLSFANNVNGDLVTAVLATPVGYDNSVTNFFRAFYGSANLTSVSADLDTSEVTSFSTAFRTCPVTSFPDLDYSATTTIASTWYGCGGLTTFPASSFPVATSISQAWRNCTGLTSFGLITIPNVTNAKSAWEGCSSLISAPSIDFGSVTTLDEAWRNCTSLTTVPANVFDNTACIVFNNAFLSCALTATSVNNILISIDAAGQSNGTLGLNGGTSAAPTGAGATAKANLIAKGWTVTTN